MVVGSEKDLFGMEVFMALQKKMGGAFCFISVGYRLAPEAKWPAALDDTIAVYDALMSPESEVAKLLGGVPDRVALNGNSAGALLAGHAAVRLSSEGKPLAFLALWYPMVDPLMKTPGYKNFGHLGLSPENWIKWCWRVLLTDDLTGKTAPTAQQLHDISLLNANYSKLKGLNTMVITGSKDAMTDDQKALAKTLHDNGLAVVRIDAIGMHNIAHRGDEDVMKKMVAFYQKSMSSYSAPPVPQSLALAKKSDQDCFTPATVDMSDPHAKETFIDSLRSTGFAVLKNHGIAPSLINQVYDEWRAFLSTQEKAYNAFINSAEFTAYKAKAQTILDDASLDKDQKRAKLDEIRPVYPGKYVRGSVEYPDHAPTWKNCGFFPSPMAETAQFGKVPDLKQYFHFFQWGQFPEPGEKHIDPQTGKEMQVTEAMHNLFEKMFVLGDNLLKWLDTAVPEATLAKLKAQNKTSLSETLSKNDTMFRILRYPSEEEVRATTHMDPGPDAMRAAAHTDINYITILPAGSTGGLQVQPKNPDTGERSADWHDVPHADGSIIVNIGDMLEEMTDGAFQSTPHRVLRFPPGERNDKLDRMSCPLFMHADPATSPYSANFKSAGEHLGNRLAALARNTPVGIL